MADIGADVDELVIADTRDQVGALNAAIRDRRHGAGEQPGELITRHGERIGLGDRVATRRNDRDLAVANRDTWTVAGLGDDGSLFVTGRAGQRALPAEYVAKHVELAFTTTVYGAQGETVDSAHLALGAATGAASAYVGMTRGRHRNVAHLVADPSTRPEVNGSTSSAATGPTSVPDMPLRGPRTMSIGTASRSPPDRAACRLPRCAP